MNKEIIKESNDIYSKNNESCTQEQVLDYAKDSNSVLYKIFCWNDTEAARRYRSIQEEPI